MKRKENKANSIETGCTVIVHLFPWSDYCSFDSFESSDSSDLIHLFIRFVHLFPLKKNCSTACFSNYMDKIMIKFYSYCFTYWQNFTCSLIWTTYSSMNDWKIIWFLGVLSTARPYQRSAGLFPWPPKLTGCWLIPTKHSSWWRRLQDVFMKSWSRRTYSH